MGKHNHKERFGAQTRQFGRLTQSEKRTILPFPGATTEGTVKKLQKAGSEAYKTEAQKLVGKEPLSVLSLLTIAESALLITTELVKKPQAAEERQQKLRFLDVIAQTIKESSSSQTLTLSRPEKSGNEVLVSKLQHLYILKERILDLLSPSWLLKMSEYEAGYEMHSEFFRLFFSNRSTPKGERIGILPQVVDAIRSPFRTEKNIAITIPSLEENMSDPVREFAGKFSFLQGASNFQTKRLRIYKSPLNTDYSFPSESADPLIPLKLDISYEEITDMVIFALKNPTITSTTAISLIVQGYENSSFNDITMAGLSTEAKRFIQRAKSWQNYVYQNLEAGDPNKKISTIFSLLMKRFPTDAQSFLSALFLGFYNNFYDMIINRNAGSISDQLTRAYIDTSPDDKFQSQALMYDFRLKLQKKVFEPFSAVTLDIPTKDFQRLFEEIASTFSLYDDKQAKNINALLESFADDPKTSEELLREENKTLLARLNSGENLSVIPSGTKDHPLTFAIKLPSMPHLPKGGTIEFYGANDLGNKEMFIHVTMQTENLPVRATITLGNELSIQLWTPQGETIPMQHEYFQYLALSVFELLCQRKIVAKNGGKEQTLGLSPLDAETVINPESIERTPKLPSTLYLQFNNGELVLDKTKDQPTIGFKEGVRGHRRLLPYARQLVTAQQLYAELTDTQTPDALELQQRVAELEDLVRKSNVHTDRLQQFPPLLWQNLTHLLIGGENKLVETLIAPTERIVHRKKPHTGLRRKTRPQSHQFQEVLDFLFEGYKAV